MKRLSIATVAGIVVLLLGTILGTEARANGFGFYYTPGYSGYGSYYGHGGHDIVPHWHRTVTPFGRYYWYGQGSHDYEPHFHSYTPYSYRGYSFRPWGYTESIYPRYPYYYSWW